MNPTDAAVLGVAVFFAAMGAYGLAAPAALIRPFGIKAATPEARTEIRAVYGGFGIAIAALLTTTALHDDIPDALRDGTALAVGVALGGMALGRLVSRCLERPSAFYPSWLYFWVEVAGAGLLITPVVW